MAAKNPAIKRIHADIREIRSSPSDQYYAEPLCDNLFDWHFTIRGPADTEYEGGIYHGRIQLPPEWPFKPPAISFFTENGRFSVGTKICLSISPHHPESWQPAWGIRLILEALISFFPTKAGGGIGGLDRQPEERRRLARLSQESCCPKCGKIADLLKSVLHVHQKESKNEPLCSLTESRVTQNSSNLLDPKSTHMKSNLHELIQKLDESSLEQNRFDLIGANQYGSNDSISLVEPLRTDQENDSVQQQINSNSRVLSMLSTQAGLVLDEIRPNSVQSLSESAHSTHSSVHTGYYLESDSFQNISQNAETTRNSIVTGSESIPNISSSVQLTHNSVHISPPRTNRRPLIRNGPVYSSSNQVAPISNRVGPNLANQKGSMGDNIFAAISVVILVLLFYFVAF